MWQYILGLFGWIPTLALPIYLSCPRYLASVWSGTIFGSPSSTWARPRIVLANSRAKQRRGNQPPKYWLPNLARASHRDIKGTIDFFPTCSPLSPSLFLSPRTEALSIQSPGGRVLRRCQLLRRPATGDAAPPLALLSQSSYAPRSATEIPIQHYSDPLFYGLICELKSPSSPYGCMYCTEVLLARSEILLAESSCLLEVKLEWDSRACCWFAASKNI